MLPVDHSSLQIVRLKLQQAEKHIADVRALAAEFLGDGLNLVEVYLESDPDGLRQIIKARSLKKPPFRISLTASDAISNMRSALDYLVKCLAAKNGKSIKEAAFPFAGDWKQFESDGVQNKIRALNADAKRMIQNLQPFPVSEGEPDKGGNNKLWAMNKLRNVDIHEMVVPIGLASLGVNASVQSQGHLGRNVFQVPTRFGFEADGTAEVMRIPGKPEDVRGQVSLAIEVGFGEIFPVAGYPVLMVLGDFYGLTSQIVAEANQKFFAQ